MAVKAEMFSAKPSAENTMVQVPSYKPNPAIPEIGRLAAVPLKLYQLEHLEIQSP